MYTMPSFKSIVFLDVTPCGSCKNRRFGWKLLFLRSVLQLLLTAIVVPSSLILFTRMMETIPVKKTEINDRRGSIALTTRHPSIHKSWH
jgi:hypothetical protein